MAILDTWRGPNKPKDVRAFIGWAGLIVLDSSVDVLDMLRSYYRVAMQESCGQCFPCRYGLKKIHAILEKRCNNQGDDKDLEELTSIAELVHGASRCDIGQTSPKPLLDVLKKAPELLSPKQVIGKKYTSIVTAPCMSACPANVDIPDYLEKVKYRQFDEAMHSVMKRCSMPGTIGRVCFRPCEQSCKRALVDSSIAIKHIKRFIADTYVKNHGTPTHHRTNMTGKRVAIIGAGPAGLACAYSLAEKNYFPTIFEAKEEAGGMAKYGIPDFRLPSEDLALDVARIREMGCTIHYGTEIGKDLTIEDLERQGYQAVFVAAGAQVSSKMYCEGEDENYHGFMSGVEYLDLAARSIQKVHGKTAIVVGGGNVAMDCIRTARRQGFETVHLIYRRTLNEMPADKHEIHEAENEGVTFNFLLAPVKIEEKNGKVTGLICQQMELGEADASGRRTPVPVKDGLITMPCDAIIAAVGQAVTIQNLASNMDKYLSPKKGYLEADSITCQVPENLFIFGGGDCVTGPDTLVAALAAGRRAASHIMEALEGKVVQSTLEERLQMLVSDIGVLGGEEEESWKGYTERIPVRSIDPEVRLMSNVEVEEGATDEEAIKESSRCLRCYRIAMADF